MSTITENQSIEGSMEPDMSSSELTKDEIFHVLQNERRRRVLEYLEGTDEPVDMRDIAEQVAAWEHDTSLQALTSNERQRVYIALYQSHLPKLDSLGLIDYNQSRGIVVRKSLADRVSPYIDRESAVAEGTVNVSTEEAPWIWHYAAASFFSVALVTAAWIGIQPLAGISGLIIASIIVIIFVGLTGGYVNTQRKRAQALSQ